jgi:ATP-GRASP peptide maturase of grasp-with-spasm system
MILILSTSQRETTTEKVIDWLEASGASFLRLNGEDFCSGNYVQIDFSNREFRIRLDKIEVSSRTINVIWNRRLFSDSMIDNYLNSSSGDRTERIIKKHLLSEIKGTFGAFMSIGGDIKWIDHPDKANVRKSDQILFAEKAGLDVPRTLITTSREEAYSFIDLCESVITKSINNGEFFAFQTTLFAHYTSLVRKKDLLNLSPYFFPTLFQELIEKDVEVRVFFLGEKCYSMAIFSQTDNKTKIDFRNYNPDKPNRFVPYTLPSLIVAKLKCFMKLVGLETGSIDIIKDVKGIYYFLEVNPVGQFGMVSSPCNYYLEREMANYLVKCDQL